MICRQLLLSFNQGINMSSTNNLPSIEGLSALPPTSQAHALNLLFEPSETLHNLVIPSITSTTFSSYDELIDHVHSLLVALAKPRTADPSAQKTGESPNRAILHSILGSHPRLGAPKVDSAQSAAEQARLQGDSEQTAKLAALNAEYEATFPGLRYVVFVNGRGRPEIMDNMRARIDRGNFEMEEQEAINVGLSFPPPYRPNWLLIEIGHV